MRVLLLHNFYEFTGGEAEAMSADRALLQARGHETMVFARTFEQIPRHSILQVGTAAQVFWSMTTYRSLRNSLRRWRPDVAHFHNIFPLISPSAYAACHAERIPVVQTLHNYRLVCPAGTLLRDGKVCELCVGVAPWPAVHYRCYRGSRAQSLVMSATIGAHALLGTWRNSVDAYIALTEFGRGIFLRGGLPADRLFVRPNALETPDQGRYAGPHSAIFVGRLSPEKGLDVLLDAWEKLPEVPLTIVGGGSLLSRVRSRVTESGASHVEVTGELPHAQVLERIGQAGMLIFPSLWYEGLGYVALEALARGVPVIASRLGVMAEVVDDGISGLLFEAGNANSLVAAVTRLVGSPRLADALAHGARRTFLERYSVDQSYSRLMEIYRFVGVRS